MLLERLLGEECRARKSPPMLSASARDEVDGCRIAARAPEFREARAIVFGEYVALAVGFNRHRTLAATQ
jgi:hypothetical protein